MSKAFFAFSAVAAAIVAHAAHAQTNLIGPSGKPMHISKCSQSPTDCYQQATNACAGAYQVLDSYSKTGGLFADALPGPVTWYYMTYQCGAGNNQMPSFPFRGQQYSPPPVVNQAPSRPTTTTCSRNGQFINCNSY